MRLVRKLFSFNRAEHMRLLHAQGRYQGTSKIGLWNISDEKRERMKAMMLRNALDKSAVGYGSEHLMRINNRNLLHNKFQGHEGILYFLRFPKSVKVGFSKAWERRVNYELPKSSGFGGGAIIAMIYGPTDTLADLEFDVLEKFKKHTLLSSDGRRYTEFLDPKVRKEVYKYLEEKVRKDKSLKFQQRNLDILNAMNPPMVSWKENS